MRKDRLEDKGDLRKRRERKEEVLEKDEELCEIANFFSLFSAECE